MTGTGFLPATPEELKERGIGQPDFVYVIGDAYVDHPSFGPAIIGRVLESRGYTVAILSQPDWRDPRVSRSTGNRAWPFSSPPGTWIPWSTIIPSRKSAGGRTLTRRAASWGSGRTGRTWSTAA